MITLSYLEFYSGIGGWGYALETACRSIGRAAAVNLESGHQQKKAKLTNKESSAKNEAIVHPLHIGTKLLAAYDHSDLCNSVFMRNHTSHDDSAPPSKSFKPHQTPIEKISKQELESHAASVWCMSPPCQPHTRQHSNQHKELDDPRSRSFLHLCTMLKTMDEEKLPCLVLLENVVGFESAWGTSDKDASPIGSFAEWRSALALRKYEVAHFHLDPTHVGLPNNRPRYYCVAVRPGSLHQRLEKEGGTNFVSRPLLNQTVLLDNIFSQEKLNEKPTIHTETSTGIGLNGIDFNINTESLPRIERFLDADLMASTNPTDEKLVKKQQSLQIPQKVQTSSSAWCFDIVTPQHTCSACFTHSYGKYIRGTGSILYYGPLRIDGETERGAEQSIPSIERFQLASPDKRSFDESWSDGINWEYMRYLSGTEIARLMGFPVSDPAAGDLKPTDSAVNEEVRGFRFPANCTMKQQWKLLGNSLNVQVAAKVAEIGIQAILNDA